MFSDRFDWGEAPNPLSRLLQEKTAAGTAVLDLTASNPTRAGFEYDADIILNALAHPDGMVYTPDPQGLETARQAVAAYYRDIGCEPSLDRLFLTASTSEAYSVLFKLLGNPEDEILIPRPGYPLLTHLARFEGLRPFSYPLRYDDEQGWDIDLDVLEALITPRTRAVVVVSPNNPTGSYLRRKTLAALDRVCSRSHLALIVDEVFSDFVAEEAPPDRVETALNRTEALTFVLNGFSKLVALPQMKLGWIAVSGESNRVRAARSRLETLLDFYLSVGTPIQLAAPVLFRLRGKIQSQVQSRLSENHRYLKTETDSALNCRVLRREGGWYAVIDIADAVTDEDRVLRLLDLDNTLIHPGYFYDFHREGFVVVSLLPSPNIFAAGIDRLIARFGSVTG
ncbi:MAG: pyridoxal phosphate-dependent aminotransferase [Desulfococcaceae bacterium]